jgi:hypothetical protein
VGRFSLVEGQPTPALDVTDDVDESGEVTKTAATKLREAVEADIARERERLAEVSPTRVRNQGASQTPPAGEQPKKLAEGTDKTEAEDEGPQSEWAQFLEEAGVDPKRAYAA